MWCWIARWQISRCHDNGRSLPGGVSRHVSGCGDCRAHAGALEALAATLTEPVAGDEPSSFLAGRIMASLPPVARRETGVGWSLGWAAGVAVVGAAVALFVTRPSVPPDPGPGGVTGDVASDVPVLASQLWQDTARPILEERECLSRDIAATRDFLLAQL